jgi:hypothetical protein
MLKNQDRKMQHTWANQKLFPTSFIFIMEKSLTFLFTWSSLIGSISNNPVSSTISAVSIVSKSHILQN